MTVKPITGFKVNGETQPVSYPHLHGKTAVEFTEQTLTDEQKRQARLNIDAPVTGDLDAAKKQIENLKKLAQGKLYDFETDETEAYVKNVSTGAAPYAAMKAIGGKSIVMNQLADVKDKVADGGVYFVALSYKFNVADGHKILIKLDVTSEFDYPRSFNFYIRGNTYSSGEYIKVGANTFSKIVTLSNNTADKNLYFYPNSSSTGVGNPDAKGTTLTVTAQCFDLTQMFGAGNEPATVEAFEAMFPAEYYEYNKGEIVSAEVQNVKSVGRNLLTRTIQIDDSDTKLLDFGKIKHFDSLTLSIKVKNFSITNATSAAFDFYSDKDRYVTWPTLGIYANNVYSGMFKVTVKDVYLKTFIHYCYTQGYGKVSGEVESVQLEIGEQATEHVPHKENNFYIPEAVKQLEGYGWSAGTAKNWVDFEKKVYHREVASIDLGTGAWSTQNECFVSYISGIYTDGVYGAQSNICCSKYVAGRITYRDSIIEKTISKTTGINTQVAIRDSSYTDLDSFKSAIQGVMLYYELAEPEEIDISDILTDDNLIEVEQGGTLTFENTRGDSFRLPVPSDVEYMINLKDAVA